MSTIDELMRDTAALAAQAKALNAKLQEWRRPDAPFGDPMNNAVNLSGTRVFDRIAYWLQEARKEAGG